MVRNVALVFGVVMGISTIAAADSPDEGFQEKIESLINSHVESPLPFNGSVLVAHKGEVVYRGAFGTAAFNSETKNTVDSKYFIASITKQYTTVSILQLVDQGKLKLEDKLSKWLPQITGADKITLHHLLTHQSGLPRDAKQPYDADVSAFERAVSLKDKALDFEPGEQERYSNLGFYALTHILQEVSGQPYEEYFSKNIFVPAGMENTGVRRTKDEVIPGLSVGIGMAPDEFGVNNFAPAQYFDSYSLSGGGSLYSTIDDEFKFFTALENGTLLPMDVVKEMKKRWPVTGKSRENYYHSYGWEVWDLKSGKIFDFMGRIQGYVSSISYYEDTDVLVIILCNNVVSDRELVPAGIQNIVLGKDFDEEVSRIPNNIPITDAMKKHEGEYDYPKEKTTVKIEIVNGKMTLRSHGDAPIYLYADDANTFYSDVTGLTITFEPTSNEQTQKLVFNYEDFMVATLSRMAL
jgi:CubicO group peptidase (beta-lactamase class C family)